MTAIVITEQAVQDATNEAGMQARTAAKAFLQKHGDRDACGFCLGGRLRCPIQFKVGQVVAGSWLP